MMDSVDSVWMRPTNMEELEGVSGLSRSSWNIVYKSCGIVSLVYERKSMNIIIQ